MRMSSRWRFLLVREKLAALLESLRAVSPQTRWVRPENLT